MKRKNEQRPQYEYRTYDVTSLDVLARSDEQPERIVGHAAVFNVIGDGGYFREKIAPGAFAKTIQADDIRALFNHDANFVLGRNTAGTLTLREDDKGLWIEVSPPDTQFAHDLMISISRGDISQMSFGFQIISEERQKGEGNEPDLYTLREVKLWDVSPVTFPFYQQTDVSVHSREQWAAEQGRPRVLPVGTWARFLQKEFARRKPTFGPHGHRS